MEIMKEKNSPVRLYLVSVKSKTSNEQGKVYAVSSVSLDAFIAKHLCPDVILLIDTIDTYGLSF